VSSGIPREALSRDLLNEQAADLLRDTILRGEIPPGTKLGEREVARMLGVSRAPVRDALLRLEGEGLVTSRRDGRYVIDLDREDFVELFAVRRVLETLAIRLAVASVSDSDVVRLREIMAELEKAYAAQDAATYALWDVRMHHCLWRMAKNRHLARVLHSLAGPISMTVFASASDSEGWCYRLYEHEELLAGLEARDADAAAAAMERHLDNSLSRILARVPAKDPSVACGFDGR